MNVLFLTHMLANTQARPNHFLCSIKYNSEERGEPGFVLWSVFDTDCDGPHCVGSIQLKIHTSVISQYCNM